MVGGLIIYFYDNVKYCWWNPLAAITILAEECEWLKKCSCDLIIWLAIVGTYQNKTGASKCLPCPAGSESQ